jgi:nicotinate-nucleotide adenylyltransferase
MLALATQEDARFCISTVELDAPERPYTVETLSQMRERLRQDVQLFFVMGADSWMEITTWREWERVLTLASHIVVTRPGYEVSAGHVTPAIRASVIDLRGMRTEEIVREVEKMDGSRIYITDAVNLEVSSTEIRRAVREGRDDEWMTLVAPSVADYIRKYGLYR